MKAFYSCVKNASDPLEGVLHGKEYNCIWLLVCRGTSWPELLPVVLLAEDPPDVAAV
jgi:hypothetical protein